ncbi:MAG: hypothetical protein ACK4ZW_05265 [Blastomonas sp.]
MNWATRSAMLATAAFLCIGATSEMTAAQFLAAMNKAESLGPAALMSSDVRALRAESDRVLTLYRSDIARQTKAGGPRHSCPPPKGEGKMKGEELKTYLAKLSVAKQKQPFRTALYDFMKQKYPCK